MWFVDRATMDSAFVCELSIMHRGILHYPQANKWRTVGHYPGDRDGFSLRCKGLLPHCAKALTLMQKVRFACDLKGKKSATKVLGLMLCFLKNTEPLVQETEVGICCYLLCNKIKPVNTVQLCPQSQPVLAAESTETFINRVPISLLLQHTVSGDDLTVLHSLQNFSKITVQAAAVFSKFFQWMCFILF